MSRGGGKARDVLPPRGTRTVRLLAGGAAVLLLAACGGSDGDDTLGIGGDLDDGPRTASADVADVADVEGGVDEDACPVVDAADVREAFTLAVREATGDDDGCTFLLEGGGQVLVERVVGEDDLDDLELVEFLGQRASARTSAGDDVVEVEVGDGGYVLRGQAYVEVVGDDALWSLEVVGDTAGVTADRERTEGLLALAVEAFDDGDD